MTRQCLEPRCPGASSNAPSPVSTKVMGCSAIRCPRVSSRHASSTWKQYPCDETVGERRASRARSTRNTRKPAVMSLTRERRAPRARTQLPAARDRLPQPRPVAHAPPGHPARADHEIGACPGQFEHAPAVRRGRASRRRRSPRRTRSPRRSRTRIPRGRRDRGHPCLARCSTRHSRIAGSESIGEFPRAVGARVIDDEHVDERARPGAMRPSDARRGSRSRCRSGTDARALQACRHLRGGRARDDAAPRGRAPTRTTRSVGRASTAGVIVDAEWHVLDHGARGSYHGSCVHDRCRRGR